MNPSTQVERIGAPAEIVPWAEMAEGTRGGWRTGEPEVGGTKRQSRDCGAAQRVSAADDSNRAERESQPQAARRGATAVASNPIKSNLIQANPTNSNGEKGQPRDCGAAQRVSSADDSNPNKSGFIRVNPAIESVQSPRWTTPPPLLPSADFQSILKNNSQ